MGQSDKLTRIVFDWGFTRLKAWTIIDKTVVFERQCFTAELSANPSYYDNNSLYLVEDWLLSFLADSPRSSTPSIHLSSQMHCLAGTYRSGERFVSTWSDPPLAIKTPQLSTTGSEVISAMGIPLLNSMPINKITKQPSSNLFYTRLKTSSHTPDCNLLHSLTSPLSLVLTPLFADPPPISQSWWESTCIPDHLPISPTLQSSPIFTESKPTINSLSHSYIPSNSPYKIYPETGDLQASIFSALAACDIVVNLGTGSQIIFKDPTLLDVIPYTRSWNSATQQTACLSHIPCGRMLSEYTRKKGLSFQKLLEIFSNLNSDYILDISARTQGPLLFYPGYCSFSRAYYQEALVSTDDLSKLEPHVLLVRWLTQYSSLIRHYSGHSVDPTTIRVTGHLGGFAPLFVRFLQLLLGNDYIVSHESASLPVSVIAMNIISEALH